MSASVSLCMSVLFILVSVNLIIKVCYILKDCNPGDYFSPDFVKMDFQKGVWYSVHKHMKMCRLYKGFVIS